MKPSETAQVCQFIWHVHGWNLADDTIRAWHRLIGDLEFDTAMRGAETHFRTSTERITPAHIRRACAGTGQRRQGVPQNPLPDSYLKEMNKWT